MAITSRTFCINAEPPYPYMILEQEDAYDGKMRLSPSLDHARCSWRCNGERERGRGK